MKTHEVTWVEVLGQNPDKLRGFYGKLFDWKFQPLPDPKMDYGLLDKEQTGIGGGIGKAPQGPGWTTFYVKVDDVAATLALAEKHGGKVLMPPMTLPDGGVIGVFADPEGHPIGLSKM
jgi:predicted enzyme related to lactoylglutathione lyase